MIDIVQVLYEGKPIRVNRDMTEYKEAKRFPKRWDKEFDNISEYVMKCKGYNHIAYLEFGKIYVKFVRWF